MINGVNSGDLEARLFVGMGGSGMKTLVEFVRLLTQHSEAAKQSEVFMAYLLVDTDMGELALCKKQIEDAYAHVHREPILAAVHLSADITDFSAFVSSKLLRGNNHDRLKEVWWYRGADKPFTAINLKDSPTRGAGQCPLVSTFLAWNQMRQIETTIDELLDTLKNRSVQGENLQNWTLNVSMVASLAGGTGRGCWHLVASKIREKLRDLNIRPKPTGFFFDSSVFAETVKREEQVTKLQVNSLTGVSELVAWLRNEYDRDSALEPYRFRLPSLNDPEVESSDLIDTGKLSQSVTGDVLHGVAGRAPVSAAYLIFGAGKQGTLGKAEAYYRSVATALYARLAASIASKNINEAGHLNGMAAATISVSIAGVLEYIREYVREFLPREYSVSQPKEKIDAIVAAVLQGALELDGVVEPRGDDQAANVPQRVYKLIGDETTPTKSSLGKSLTNRAYRDAESQAKELSDWADTNETEIKDMVRRVLVRHYWGERTDESGTLSGGVWGTRMECGSANLTDQESEGLFAEATVTKRLNPLALFVKKMLRSNSLRVEDADRTTDYDISSYGTKLTIAEGVISALEKISERISDATLPDPTQSESPTTKLEQARAGFFASGVTDAESDVILRSVEPWVLGSSNKAIREALKTILAQAVDELKRYELAVSKVTDRLSRVAKEMHESTLRLRENFFWGEKDFERILEEGQSAFDQEILSTQVLKAVGEDAELTEEFRRVMREEAPAGFSDAQRDFFKFLGQWIDDKATRTDPSLDRRLPDIVAENLQEMADQFLLSDRFVEKNFGFFETVKRLLREWGKKMVERQGSPQDRAKLASVFRNQFGIEYRKSNLLKDEADSPKALDEVELRDFTHEVCKSMAVRLGGRCDPLFQQRFDEGERPTYDSVCVVLPAEEEFDKPFAKDVEELAEQNPQFKGAGNFKAVDTYGNLDTGNPYTMLAYATQQFEDWRQDTGLARIASLEYYKTPMVLNWLRACEDPNGAAVFVVGKELQRFGIHSHRDIYGLGYISPLFVRNETLKELRWSPWDESKKRSANKRNERIDLLAYALLAPPQAAPEGSPAAAARHFNEILFKAEWPMPLLAWQDSSGSDSSQKKWHFMRQAFRRTTKVTATKSREADHPAFEADHGYPSIRRCLDELLENHAIAQAIAGEAEMFMSEVLCKTDFEDEFRPEDDINVTFGYLRDRLEVVKTQQEGPAAEKMVKLIDELLARVKELRNLTPEQLKEHYEGIRRNTELYSRA